MQAKAPRVSFSNKVHDESIDIGWMERLLIECFSDLGEVPLSLLPAPPSQLSESFFPLVCFFVTMTACLRTSAVRSYNQLCAQPSPALQRHFCQRHAASCCTYCFLQTCHQRHARQEPKELRKSCICTFQPALFAALKEPEGF